MLQYINTPCVLQYYIHMLHLTHLVPLTVQEVEFINK